MMRGSREAPPLFYGNNGLTWTAALKLERIAQGLLTNPMSAPIEVASDSL